MNAFSDINDIQKGRPMEALIGHVVNRFHIVPKHFLKIKSCDNKGSWGTSGKFIDGAIQIATHHHSGQPCIWQSHSSSCAYWTFFCPNQNNFVAVYNKCRIWLSCTMLPWLWPRGEPNTSTTSCTCLHMAFYCKPTATNCKTWLCFRSTCSFPTLVVDYC